jgi:hypothetical protein
MGVFKKTSPRRSQVRKNISADRASKKRRVADPDVLISLLLWLLFVLLCTSIVSFDLVQQRGFRPALPLAAVLILISVAAGFYIYHYQKRIIKNHARAAALVGLFILLLIATKFGALAQQSFWATGMAVIASIILTIAYDQRFAIGMSTFYYLFACFAAQPTVVPTTDAAVPGQLANISLFLVMAAGGMACCFSLREIRTRMKLLQVSVLAATLVFMMASALHFLTKASALNEIIRSAGYHAGITLVVGVLMQGLLPVIEKIFRIATSMTLLDFSDANQPLLKRLAMEAPGTFSHSLLIGSIAEAAAEAIGRNGLLCRVGAYYHDIGKLNKPHYFVENEMGAASRHKELSPTMSQLIIVGHVKDGIEMAKEYGLPAVLRQFIETHHGTTLLEPFYNEAKKKHEAPGADGSSARKPKQAPPSESEFRYTGPKPRTKEAAIVMLTDAIEGAVRSLSEVTPTKIETVVHNMAMKRLQDGQFDECDLSLRELSQIETSMAKTLAAHYHGRVAYPTAPDESETNEPQAKQPEQKALSKQKL